MNFNDRFFLGKCEIVAACWHAECSDMLTVTNESFHVGKSTNKCASSLPQKVGKLINDMYLSSLTPVIWSSYIRGM